MTELDDKLRPGVERILNRVGASFTLSDKADAGDYDPTTGAVVYSVTDYTVKATPPFPFNEEALKGEAREGESDIIREGDMVTLLSAKLLDDASTPVPDPLPGWTMTIRSKTWTVLVVAPIMSGEQVCAWILKLGR